jgi:hypothetical protein
MRRILQRRFWESMNIRQKLAYVYFEDEPGRRSAAKLPAKDETKRFAVNFAKLPDLVGKAHRGEDEASH